MPPEKIIEFAWDENEDWEKEQLAWQAAGAADTLKRLGELSREELDYYNNLTPSM